MYSKAKKIICGFLSALMIMGVSGGFVLAEEAPIVVDGNFENGIKSWQAVGSSGFDFISDGVYRDSLSLMLSSKDDIYVSQKIFLVPDKGYIVKLYAKSGSEAVTGRIGLTFIDEGGTEISSEESKFNPKSEWGEISYKFKAPAGADAAKLIIGLAGGGTIYIDDVSVIGSVSPKTTAQAQQAAAIKSGKVLMEPLAGEPENLIVNGGIETISADGKGGDGIGALGDWGGQYVSLEKGEVHSGSYSAKIETKSGGNPYIFFNVGDLIEKATYQLTLWYKAEIRGNQGFAVKIENYSGNTFGSANGLQSYATDYYTSTSGWSQLIYTFAIPDNGGMIRIYPRMYSTDGTVYVDDAKLCMVQGPPMFSMTTDQTFYYENYAKGTAAVSLHPLYKDENYTVDYELLDGVNKLDVKNGVKFAAGVSSYDFDMKLLSEKKKEYVVKATIKDSKGNIFDILTRKVYRYDRPKAITEDGVYMKDGKPFNGKLMYHIYEDEDQNKAVTVGINVMQGGMGGNGQKTLELLDAAEKKGMMVGVVLYYNMKPAGHPSNIERTKEIVNAIKDHPALFGYMVMDEPFANDPNIEDLLRISYKTIRDIDDVHPIMICECWASCYEATGKYCDIMEIDPYPGDWNDYGTHTAKMSELAVKTLNYNKPVAHIMQVFSFAKSKPQPHELRHMFYQAYLAGNQYIFFYPWQKETQFDVDLDESEYWPELQSFEKLESEIAFRHFTTRETPTYNKYRDDKVWYESWTDGKDIYSVVLNLTKENQTANVSLVSSNGKLTPGAYDLNLVNGGEMSAVTKGDASFSVNLTSHQAVLFKIHPSNAIDTEKLTLSSFEDLGNYPWAADAINTLYGAGILNKTGDTAYSPEKNVTRGDFAMFLIRTLGLTAEASENFSDVPADAEYSKEIAIGKALGILNGTGGGEFNPTAPISRQDLIAISARGMKASGKLGNGDTSYLDKFADKDTIAEYAKESVSAMVKQGIITGDDTGNINPLGFATRAEAAVIMYKISKAPGVTATEEPKETNEEPKETAQAYKFDKEATEAEKASWNKAVTFLKKVGIISGNFDSAGTLTRGEAAKIMMLCYGITNQLSGSETGFSDVPSSNEYSGYINAAVQKGLMSGRGDGTFGPDDPVTYNEIVKMIVDVLGYKAYAEWSGGYPEGYLMHASRLGLLKQVSDAEGDKPVRAGIAALIIINALDVELAERTTYGGLTENYKVKEDSSFLSEYLGVYKFEGKVSGNSFTSIDGVGLLKDEISLDGRILKTGITNAADFLGQKVTVYAKEDDSGALKILDIAPNSPSVMLSINGYDVSDGKTTKTRLYYDNSKAKKEEFINITQGATLIYNGKFKTDWTKDTLGNNNGTITFIMNDGSTADVIIIDDYANYVVDKVDIDADTVYFKNGGSIVLPLEDRGYKISLTDSLGASIIIDGFSEWNILTVSKSEDGKTIKAVLSDTSLSGEPEEIYDEAVVIDGTEYKIARDSVSMPALGVDAVYYLNFKDEIVARDDIPAVNYGYFTSIGISEGIDKKVSLRIFTKEGQMKIFDAADTVTYNGDPMPCIRLMDKTELIENHIPKGQLVIFEINDNEKLISLTTAKDGTTLDKEARLSSFSKDVATTGDGGNYIYHGYVASWLGSTYRVDKTYYFKVPEKLSDKASDYSVAYGTNAFAHGSQYANCAIFDVDENYRVGAIVQTAQTYTELYYTGTQGIITSIGKAMDADGNLTNVIEIITPNNKTEKLFIDDEFMITFTDKTITNRTNSAYDKDELVRYGMMNPAYPFWYTVNPGKPTEKTYCTLKVGDTVLYQANAGGNITGMKMLVRGYYAIPDENLVDGTIRQTYTYSPITLHVGFVKELIDGGAVLDVGKGYDRVVLWANSSGEGLTFIYDKAKQTITKSSVQSVKEGDKILVVRTNPYTSFVIIYR